MKIALVCNHFYPSIGGVETVVFQLASNMAALGMDVTVLTQNGDSKLMKKEIKNNFTILRFNEIGFDKLKISMDMLEYLQKNSKNFDIIHAHNYHTFSALCTAISKKTPIVISPHYHGSGQTILTKILHYPYRFIGRFLFSRYDEVLCDTKAEALLLKKHFPSIKEILVTPLGIEVEEIKKTKRVSSPKKYLISVGRLENYKNISLIIESLRFIKSEINLIIIGDGPELENLKSLIKRLELSSRVSILKNIQKSELFRLLKNAEAYITMSRTEAYGLSLLEGIASENGVIASDIPAHKELINEFKVSGATLLSPDTSPQNLGDSITIAMQKSVHYKSQLPSWKRVTEQTLEVYKNLLAEKIKPASII